MKRAVLVLTAAGMLAALSQQASAQQPDQTLPAEQLYRNINAALAQDNARLGFQVQELTSQIQRMNAELQKAKKPDAPAEKK